MKRAVFALALAAALAGCVTPLELGPYVKSVSRQGDWLVLERCLIDYEDHLLYEGKCTKESVPIAAFHGPPGIAQPPAEAPPPPPSTR